MILAPRIAAITIFGKRSSIWLGNDAIDAGDEDVILRDLCGEQEMRDGETCPANGSAVREVPEYTGLFTSGRQHRLRWRHQTYAEFLAARYLWERDMRLSQKLDLILHHGDPEKKVVPQLHDTAAWLAGMDQAVFEVILESEPELLLRSDVAKARLDGSSLIDGSQTIEERGKPLSGACRKLGASFKTKPSSAPLKES